MAAEQHVQERTPRRSLLSEDTARTFATSNLELDYITEGSGEGPEQYQDDHISNDNQQVPDNACNALSEGKNPSSLSAVTYSTQLKSLVRHRAVYGAGRSTDDAVHTCAQWVRSRH